MRTFQVCFLSLIVSTCAAQWQVSTNVLLDGATDGDRQVQGLGAPEGGDHGVSAVSERTMATAFAVASGIDVLEVTLSPAPSNYVPGMRISFLPSAPNSGEVTINANGLGPVPLRKNINVPLDSGDLHAGIPVQVIYDGTVFQVMSQLHPGCPAGYLPVGTSSCVEAVSHGPVNWYTAVTNCSAQGRRLCGFAEWIQACRQANSILGSIVDYEWVDEAANSTNDAKTMGINANTLLPDCLSGGTRAPLELMRYRCCYDR